VSVQSEPQMGVVANGGVGDLDEELRGLQYRMGGVRAMSSYTSGRRNSWESMRRGRGRGEGAMCISRRAGKMRGHYCDCYGTGQSEARHSSR